MFNPTTAPPITSQGKKKEVELSSVVQQLEKATTKIAELEGVIKKRAVVSTERSNQRAKTAIDALSVENIKLKATVECLQKVIATFKVKDISNVDVTESKGKGKKGKGKEKDLIQEDNGDNCLLLNS